MKTGIFVFIAMAVCPAVMATYINQVQVKDSPSASTGTNGGLGLSVLDGSTNVLGNQYSSDVTVMHQEANHNV
ncbi:hypothetical protein BX666DRAFT_2032762 [Dichotomocladium elegans]|nr:hypothetical protein BX666DRAFT_2032762 [Dichotomocladium elegans]